jgi:hypothetical protein
MSCSTLNNSARNGASLAPGRERLGPVIQFCNRHDRVGMWFVLFLAIFDASPDRRNSSGRPIGNSAANIVTGKADADPAQQTQPRPC